MWNGKITDELKMLACQYAEKHYGVSPASYDELNYDAMSYEDFVGYIKEMPEVVPIW